MAAEDIKAMLAHKYNPDRADYPAYIQPKLDGVRCLFTAKGAFSRTGKQFMNVYHIEQQLNPFFAANPNTVLDGELYNHELKDDFEKIISLVRKQFPKYDFCSLNKILTGLHLYLKRSSGSSSTFSTSYWQSVQHQGYFNQNIV